MILRKNTVCSLIIIAILIFVSSIGMADTDSLYHYKMLSTVEYNGNGQYRNQLETLMTVKKVYLGDNMVRYSVSTDDYDLVKGNQDTAEDQPAPYDPISFIVDRNTKHLTMVNEDFSLLEVVHDHCVQSLDTVVKENIGKSWKQTIRLPEVLETLPNELTFSLKAEAMETEVFGEMVAVRALSDTFISKVQRYAEETKEVVELEPIKARIGTIYVFDKDIEEVYLSISVFRAVTTINGKKETVRHEIATYATDSSGQSLDFTGLGKKFENLVRGLRLNDKNSEIQQEVSLPRWASFEALYASEVSQLCAATTCEGALNPVVTVSIPVARTVTLMSQGALSPVGGLAMAGTVGGALGTGVPAVGALGITGGPIMGFGTATGVAIAAGTATTAGVLIAGSDGGGAGDAPEPASPF